LIAGVSAGVAESMRIDVTLVRFAFLVLALASGIGAILYVVLWLVMPSEGVREPRASGRERAVFRIEQVGSEVWGMSRDLLGDLPRLERPILRDRGRVAVIAIAVGAVVLLASFGLFAWITPVRGLGLAAIALGVAALTRLNQPIGGRR
jgi:phage shock protein PspC (stress-responsive transcriptional regulator)